MTAPLVLLVALLVSPLLQAAPTCPTKAEKLLTVVDVKTAADVVTPMLRDYRAEVASGGARIQNAEKLEFTGTEGRDVYNGTAVFEAGFHGKTVEVLLGRTEETHLETGTEAIFYTKNGQGWEALAGAPKFKLQDPFFNRIANELVVGGVETFEKPDHTLGYRTVFYRDHGRGIEHLTRFAAGPYGMKDIRLVSLKDGRILLFTRPQGEVGGRGKIGAAILQNLRELTPAAITAAPLLEGQFSDAQWGGVNCAYLLENGTIGVLGHIARYDSEGNRDYYPMAFTFNPATRVASPMKILLERADLPSGVSGKSKRKDLKNVLFSAGLVRHPDGSATFYVAAGDAELYRVTIRDPFAER